jgi:hypothetical protein
VPRRAVVLDDRHEAHTWLITGGLRVRVALAPVAVEDALDAHRPSCHSSCQPIRLPACNRTPKGGVAVYMNIQEVMWAVGLLLLLWRVYETIQTGKGRGYI